MNYTKLFNTILDSTIWQEELPTKVVWITMLAMADRDGVVSAAVPGLARRAGVSVEECEAALARFLAADEHSRSREFEGRRIEKVWGGWRLLNHSFYRALMSAEDRREYNRKKQAEYRAKKKGSVPAGVSFPDRSEGAAQNPPEPVKEADYHADLGERLPAVPEEGRVPDPDAEFEGEPGRFPEL